MSQQPTADEVMARLGVLREISAREGFVRDAERRLRELRGLYELGTMLQRASAAMKK